MAASSQSHRLSQTGVRALERQRRVLECMIDERADGSAFWLIVPSSSCYWSRSAIFWLIVPGSCG